MSLSSPFNAILLLKRKAVTIRRPGSPDVTINSYIAPSNYSRKMEAVSDTIIYGKQFVISRDWVEESFRPIKRNDRISDTDLGDLNITEVEEMFGLGGEILGWRITTS